MTVRTGVLVAIMVSAVWAATAQSPDETSGRVPELDAFHKPIYTLWHDAWPAGDVARLKELLPAVEEAYKTLSAAKLPGILRDKADQWSSKMAALSKAMQAYRAAVAANDSTAVMQAAERVHSSYEMLVRTVRPMLKELDAFHQVLYVLHHYDVPARDVAKIRASVDTLAVRMRALEGAVLPKRLEKKSEQFNKARANLAEAVRALSDASAAGKTADDLVKLEETVHTRYQVLEKVFD